MLRDATHPVPPVGGFGANAAFQDAASLCNLLCRETESQKPDLFERYEKYMLARSKTIVERSVVGSGRFFDMRPLEQFKSVIV